MNRLSRLWRTWGRGKERPGLTQPEKGDVLVLRCWACSVSREESHGNLPHEEKEKMPILQTGDWQQNWFWGKVRNENLTLWFGIDRLTLKRSNDSIYFLHHAIWSTGEGKEGDSGEERASHMPSQGTILRTMAEKWECEWGSQTDFSRRSRKKFCLFDRLGNSLFLLKESYSTNQKYIFTCLENILFLKKNSHFWTW